MNIPRETFLQKADLEIYEGLTYVKLDDVMAIMQKHGRDDESADDPHKIPVWELDLMTRTLNALYREGISTVGKLIECTPFDLKEMSGIGDIAVNDIITKLDDMGYTLMGSDEQPGTTSYVRGYEAGSTSSARTAWAHVNFDEARIASLILGRTATSAARAVVAYIHERLR